MANDSWLTNETLGVADERRQVRVTGDRGRWERLNKVANLHKEQESVVQTTNRDSDWFKIERGKRQCCVISPGQCTIYTGMDKLVCTPASTALFACPRPGGTVSTLYRHIRQAAIPARVVLGTAVF